MLCIYCNEFRWLYCTRKWFVLNEKPDIQDNIDAKELELKEGAVVFDKVSFSYHPQRPIFY